MSIEQMPVVRCSCTVVLWTRVARYLLEVVSIVQARVISRRLVLIMKLVSRGTAMNASVEIAFGCAVLLVATIATYTQRNDFV